MFTHAPTVGDERKKDAKIMKILSQVHSSQPATADSGNPENQRAGPQGSAGRGGWAGANRTIAGGNQNMQLSVSFRLESNCKRTQKPQKPQKGRRTLDAGL